MFKLDPIQEKAIAEICKWYTFLPKKYFVLAGRAGTGKSSIVKMAVENLAINGVVAFIAPTGKASMVMRKKGILDAITMHKLIYIPKEELEQRQREAAKPKFSIFNSNRISINEISSRIDAGEDAQDIFAGDIESRRTIAATRMPKSEISFIKKDKEELQGIKLIVCDEASLINDEQITDLESFEIPVLYIGDHHQLPPVKGSNSRITNPDFVLEKIHRQGGDSPIISLASDIIDDPSPRIKLDSIIRKYAKSTEIAVVSPTDIIEGFPEFYRNSDQILCSTNHLRDLLNQSCRFINGFKGNNPVVGDKLMCTRNNYEHKLVNGLQGYVREIKKINKLQGTFVFDFDTEAGYVVKDIVASLVPFYPPETFSEAVERYHNKARSEIDYFDFGYACTVHKSQGSEWDNVLYIQSFSHPNELRQMHYTAITRAAKFITISECLSKDDINYFEDILLNR